MRRIPLDSKQKPKRDSSRRISAQNDGIPPFSATCKAVTYKQSCRLCYLAPSDSATLHRPAKLTRMEFRFEVLKTDPTGARPGVAFAPSHGGRAGFRARRFRRRADSRAAAKFAARFRAHLPSDYTACMWSRSSPRVSPSCRAAALWKRAPPRKSSARPRTPIRNP